MIAMRGRHMNIAHPVSQGILRNRRMRDAQSPVGDASGFTLLEVLVALLVLAIGLLGLAALQTMSMKFSHQSYERTQATLLAYDILDCMRANPNGDYSATASSDPGCISASCTANQLAEHDLFHWRKAVQNSLAASAATVSTLGNAATVTLTWFENDIQQTLTINSRL